jgi:hypothetical protein
MNATFVAALAKFVASSQAAVDAYMAKHAPKNARKVIGFDVGRRYVRVHISSVGLEGKSAHCFVDMKSGDILKPDSWKGPARGIRGNIFEHVIAEPGTNPNPVMPAY